MNDPSNALIASSPQLSLLDKTATFGSWALGGALFLTIGWLAMAPDDPLGPVSLLTRSGPMLMLLEAAALAAIAAGMATVVAGRLLPDVGTFAAAVGLAAVSLRGSTAQALLVDWADVASNAHQALAAKLALDALGWIAVAIVAVGTSAVVVRWCFDRTDDGAHTDSPTRVRLPLLLSSAGRHLAGYDLPLVGEKIFGVQARRQTPLLDGLKHTLIATGLGLGAIGFLLEGLWSRSTQHGQACFVVVVGLAVACHIAHRTCPVRSALWSILAAWLIALVAYAWAAVRPAVEGLPATVPASNFLRILPIQFVAVGTATAVAMFWQTRPADTVAHHPKRVTPGT